MLKLVMRRDPRRHIAEASNQREREREGWAFIITLTFCCKTIQMQIELKLVDMARETAGGHKSYR